MRITLLLKLAAIYEEMFEEPSPERTEELARYKELVGEPAGWALYPKSRKPEEYPFPELIKEPWTGELPESFDMRTFMQLPDLPTIHLYLKGIIGKDISELGAGSSRQVFALPGGKTVLKVARNPIGMEQNQIEWLLSRDRRSWKYIAHTYEKHSKFYWLISERVIPGGVGNPPELDEDFQKLADKFLMEMTELEHPQSWGKTMDGRPVLFDYGLSDPIHDRYWP